MKLSESLDLIAKNNSNVDASALRDVMHTMDDFQELIDDGIDTDCICDQPSVTICDTGEVNVLIKLHYAGINTINLRKLDFRFIVGISAENVGDYIELNIKLKTIFK